MSDGSIAIAMPEGPAPLTGIAAKGDEIVLTMLAEEVGGGWRFGDILTLHFLNRGNPPAEAAKAGAYLIEQVLHNAFVKAKIPPYDQPLPENRLDAAQPAFVSNSQPEESGP